MAMSVIWVKIVRHHEVMQTRPFSTIQFSIPAYIKTLNAVAQEVPTLSRCPLSRSNSVRNLGLMQLRLFLHNVVRYIKLCAKSEHL